MIIFSRRNCIGHGLIRPPHRNYRFVACLRSFWLFVFITDQISFNAKVLTNSFWPIFSQTSVTLPSPLKDSEALFTKWYSEMNSSRVLKWNYTLGEVVMLATYPGLIDHEKFSIYEITVTIEQVSAFSYLHSLILC
jgi:hypothetical protein